MLLCCRVSFTQEALFNRDFQQFCLFKGKALNWDKILYLGTSDSQDCANLWNILKGSFLLSQCKMHDCILISANLDNHTTLLTTFNVLHFWPNYMFLKLFLSVFLSRFVLGLYKNNSNIHVTDWMQWSLDIFSAYVSSPLLLNSASLEVTKEKNCRQIICHTGTGLLSYSISVYCCILIWNITTVLCAYLVLCDFHKNVPLIPA